MSYLNDVEKKWDPDYGDKELYPDIDENVELRLELSNICNHACLFCPNRKMKRKRREMDSDLVKRLLQEGRAEGIRKCGLFMNGEPFISQELAFFIKFAKKLGYEYVYITTNGALASEERIKEVINAGIDSIKFSINGGSRESYNLVHQSDDYEKVMSNLKFAHEYREQYNCTFKLLSSCVVTKYMESEIEEHYKNISSYVDEIVFVRASCFAGQMIEEVKELRTDINNERIPKFKFKTQAPCNALWNSINVTCEGYLTLCCAESYNYLAIEDVNAMSLNEAWHSSRMTQMRKNHLENNLEGTMCYRCIEEKDGREDIRPLNSILYERSLI